MDWRGSLGRLSRAWASPEFTKLREQNKQNRASDYGGLGSSLHTGGSVPHTEHRRRLDDFIRDRENQQSTGEGSSSGSTQYSEYHTWSNVVGGRQRGRVYGLGSQDYAYEGNSSTLTFYDVIVAEETISAALTKEIEEIRKVQNEMQAKLQSYRDENQKKKEHEPTAESQGSKDTEDD
ncbi:hypothetical protein M5K25_005344 [Dendrobium thyrsiflorum]|uniref:Uncharacterized protein n=1 Tax=Dendrobium thyrsiflorum TaxID=117978 RepID=A0ABD0VII9_DENTH